MKSLISFLFMSFVTADALADCGKSDDICAAVSPWARANTASVRVQPENSPDFDLWDFKFGRENDLLLRIETHRDKQQTQGEILLVSGRAMLTKGISLDKGYEIDALDAPVLMYQLVVSLLGQALPEGPEKLAASRQISMAEPKRGIRIATHSASGRFPPPWSVDGTIEKVGILQFDYSLDFAYPAEDGGETVKMRLSGNWKKGSAPPTFDDTMNIEGWSLHTIGPFSIKQEGSTIYDYGAQAKPLQVRTVGELRKALARDEASSNKQLQPTAQGGG